MDDVAAVGVLECLGDLDAVADGLCLRHPAAAFGQQVTQREAMDVLHDEVGLALMAAGVVDRRDVWVLQPGDDARLAFEVAIRAGAAKELDADPAAEAQVLGEPDFRHAAGTEQPFEAISCIYDIGSVQAVVILRAVGRGLVSRDRNAELLLLAFSAGFALLAWRALDAAATPLPATTGRIVLQFLVTALLGHLALRAVAPAASALPYAAAMLLTAVGLAFVLRLAPEVAQNQANWALLGVILMAATAGAHRWLPLLRRYRYTAAAGALVLLLVTGFLGTTINGARLWISVGGQIVQTTEVIKLLVVVFLAGYLAETGAILAVPRFRLGDRTYRALPYLIPLLLAVAGLMAVLALLKDLGSVALLVLLTLSALYLATGRKLFIAGGLVLLLATSVFGYYAFDHARTRIDVWLNPYDDPSGAGYQTIQSSYAVEAGGVTGAGLGLGQPEVIPAAATDYVFSAIAEELGMAGAAAVVLLYVLLLFAGLRVAMEARDLHLQLLAALPACLLAIQAAVIIAGNLRLIPTTGITLPFVSYGGSSLVVNFVLIGLVLAVSQRTRAA